MHKECKLYAVLALNENGVAEGIEHLPVVKEFADAFPEELPRMPPERELEFTIDLKPRTEPIARTPHRMSTPELEELKMQLKELLTTAPILKAPDMDANFLVCTDASKEGLGGVLKQDGWVIAYIRGS